jgi:hypothetical protein
MDWIWHMMHPDAAYELSGRFSYTTGFLFRLSFIFLDILEKISRETRMFLCFLFVVGNSLVLMRAYFVNPAIDVPLPLFNITVTTSGTRATINQIFVSVSTFAVFTIFQDSETLFVAMCTGYLTKRDLDEEDSTNDDEAMKALDEEHEVAAIAWKSFPRAAELAMFAVLLLYLVTVALGLQGYMLDSDGNESTAFICARIAVLLLFWLSFYGIGSHSNLNRNRLNYLCRSSHAVTVFIYITLYFIVGMSFPETQAPVSSRLSVAFATSGFLLWLASDAFIRLSRVARACVTVFTVFRCVYGIYLAMFVWTYNPEVADLNGAETDGNITKLWLFTMCFFNLGLLMSGSVYTLVIDWHEGKFMTVVSGYVLRADVLALASVHDLVAGDTMEDFETQSRDSRTRK